MNPSNLLGAVRAELFFGGASSAATAGRGAGTK
jgi:hypothetical protein